MILSYCVWILGKFARIDRKFADTMSSNTIFKSTWLAFSKCCYDFVDKTAVDYVHLWVDTLPPLVERVFFLLLRSNPYSNSSSFNKIFRFYFQFEFEFHFRFRFHADFWHAVVFANPILTSFYFEMRVTFVYYSQINQNQSKSIIQPNATFFFFALNLRHSYM